MKASQVRQRRLFLGCAAFLAVVGGLVCCRPAGREMVPGPPPEEKLVPTPTGLPSTRVLPTMTQSPTPFIEELVPTPTPLPTPTPFPTPPLLPTVESPLSFPAEAAWRFGAVNRLDDLETRDWESLQAGWFLTGFGSDFASPGVDLVYLIPVQGDTELYRTEEFAGYIASRPGSLWQVGNEPDISWQSNCTPEEYAVIYDAFYRYIKKADPAALVAPGAIAQPTKLRMEYLDRILEAYRARFRTPMPVDVWTIHNAVMQEKRDEWGIGIPPGIPDATGIQVEIEDNDRLELFNQQIIDFRTWMRDRGYRERPLLITEFTILMPYYYGYDTERVAAFMTGAFDYMLNAADEEIGCPADDNRLVQRWAWYSVAAADYPTGNLTDPETGEMTPLGRIFAEFIGSQ